MEEVFEILSAFTPEEVAIVEKAIWSGPISMPQYASANEVGVQLPAPMSNVGVVEDGFEQITSADMRGMAATSPTPSLGVQLSGASRWEPGYPFGEDTRDYAPRQDAPVGQDFGALSDSNEGLQPGGEMEPFFHVVGRTPANQFDSPTAADILPAFEGLRDKFGNATPSTGGPVPGMDSMQGLPLGVGSGIVGGEGYMGQDGDFGTGDGDNDQDDFNRYAEGPVFRPGQGVKPQGAPSVVLGKQSV